MATRNSKSKKIFGYSRPRVCDYSRITFIHKKFIRRNVDEQIVHDLVNLGVSPIPKYFSKNF